MYESWWQLTAAPFASVNDPQWFVSSEANEETLARLEFLVGRNRRFGIMTGDGGTGKSFLLQYVRQCLVGPAAPVPVIDLCGRPYMDVLRELACDLAGDVAGHESEFILWRTILDEIKGHTLASGRCVLLFDHLDQAGPGGLEVVERLLSLHAQAGGGFTMIATTRHAVSSTLRDMSDLWMDLKPLTVDDTRSYIQTRMKRAGGDPSIFAPDAILRIHRASAGNPRAINRLAEMTLLEAAASESDCVTSDAVETACQLYSSTNRAA